MNNVMWRELISLLMLVISRVVPTTISVRRLAAASRIRFVTPRLPFGFLYLLWLWLLLLWFLWLWLLPLRRLWLLLLLDLLLLVFQQALFLGTSSSEEIAQCDSRGNGCDTAYYAASDGSCIAATLAPSVARGSFRA